MNAVRVKQPLGAPRRRPRAVTGDKGYSYPRIRRWLRRHAVRAVIPQRSDQEARHRGRPLSFDREAYRRRSVIECCIGWPRECRRIATRFEKLALNFLAMFKIAIMQRDLRLSTIHRKLRPAGGEDVFPTPGSSGESGKYCSTRPIRLPNDSPDSAGPSS